MVIFFFKDFMDFSLKFDYKFTNTDKWSRKVIRCNVGLSRIGLFPQPLSSI